MELVKMIAAIEDEGQISGKGSKDAFVYKFDS